MSENPSPLGRLVLFVVILSVAGTLIAGLSCFAVDQPHRENVPPENEHSCMNTCWDLNQDCLSNEEGECYYAYRTDPRDSVLEECLERVPDRCSDALNACMTACPIE